MIPLINFHWKDLSNQIDPSKYQRLLFGIILYPPKSEGNFFTLRDLLAEGL